MTRLNDRDSYHVGAGITVDLTDNWELEVFGTYAESNFQIRFLGFPHLDRLAQALDVVAGPDGPECRNPTFQAINCVPLNVYGEGQITPEMANFIDAEGGLNGFNTESDVQLLVRGDLFELPAGPVGTALGLERRFATAAELPNEVWATGSTGIQLASFESSLEHQEIFAEAIIPLLNDVPMARYLGLELGARFTKLDPGEDEWTYKALFNWSVTEKVRFRGGVQHALRAPNFFELGAGDQTFLTLAELAGVDPCFTGAPLTGDVRTSCIANGVPTAVADAGAVLPLAELYFDKFFGNPNLISETSDGISFGVVFDGLLSDGLTASIDYYKIEVTDSIEGTPFSVLFGECFESGTGGTDLFCNEIIRDPITGLVIELNSGFQNLGEFETDGIDFNVNYQRDIGGIFDSEGLLTIDVVGTHLLSDETLPFSRDPSGRFDCAGLYGGINCNAPHSEWKATTRVTWDDGPLSATLNWTWIGESTNDATVFDPAFVSELARTKIDSQSYFDLSAVWRFGDQFDIRGGITNLFDETPPVAGVDMGTPSGDNNTYPGLYDAIGRRYFVGLRLRY